MITSQQTSLLYELRQTPIPEATLVEFEARLQHRIHSMVLDAFNQSGLSQKELADRLGWDEARISRCLGVSSNWTIKTISALLTAIGVDLDDPSYTSFNELERRLRADCLTSSIEQLNRKEPPGLIWGEPALVNDRSNGSTRIPVPAMPIGAAPELKGIQPEASTQRTVDPAEYKRPAWGQNLNVSQVGEANAG